MGKIRILSDLCMLLIRSSIEYFEFHGGVEKVSIGQFVPNLRQG